MRETTEVKHYRKRKLLPVVEYYDEIRRMGCFTLQDFSRMVGERSMVAYMINEYQRNGYIERIHRNLYTAMDIETGRPILSRYQIGSRLFPDAYVSHYSAFEVWGYAPRLLDEVYVAAETRFTDFRYNGIFYRRVNPKAESDKERVSGCLVTSLEQTVVDSINNFEKIVGLEAVVECIMRLPKLDVDRLLQCLEKYGNGYLYQKCGYVMEQLQEYVDLPERFYRECREHCASTVRYMIKEAEGLVYHKGWGIYAPVLIGNRDERVDA
nr:transcriptional regulator [uncultured Acetatifactor sp.]